ncbi:MAG TPA: hypothetical protein VK473_00075 [Terriglobales bacterium]|nr:hypothetical protein [Terriglobales bacterium]
MLATKGSVWALAILAVFSAQLFGACRPGQQTGKIIKVIDEDLSAQSAGTASRPMPPGQSAKPNPATVSRSIIFAIGNQRYGLRMAPGSASQALEFSPGEELCVRTEETKIQVLTKDGEPIPGVSRPIPALLHQQVKKAGSFDPADAAEK